jgi:hypothetical protein
MVRSGFNSSGSPLRYNTGEEQETLLEKLAKGHGNTIATYVTAKVFQPRICFKRLKGVISRASWTGMPRWPTR